MMLIPGRRRQGCSSNNASSALYSMARVVLWGLFASYTGFRYRSIWTTSLHVPFASISSSSSSWSMSLSSRSISTTKQADAPIKTTRLPSCMATLELIPLVTSNYTSHFPINQLMMRLRSDSFSSSLSGRAMTTDKNNNKNNSQTNPTTTPADIPTTLQHHHHHHHSAICVFSWHNKRNPQDSSIPFLHFPHTMQIMYRCWSWWQQQQQQVQQQYQSSIQNSANTTTTGSVDGVDVSWILLLPNHKVKNQIMGPKASAFNRGFFSSLQQFANVSIQIQHKDNNKPHHVLQPAPIEKQRRQQQQQQRKTTHLQTNKKQGTWATKEMKKTLAPNHHNGKKRRLLLAPTTIKNNNSTSSSTTTTTTTTTTSTSMAGPFQSGGGLAYQVASPHHLSRLRDIFVSGFLGMDHNYHQKEKKGGPPTRILTRQKTLNGNTTTTPSVVEEVVSKTTTTTTAATTVSSSYSVLSSSSSTTTSTTAQNNNAAFPRIAIVNREGHRKLVNAHKIAKEVEQRLAVLWRTSNSSDSYTTTTTTRTTVSSLSSSSLSSSSSRNIPGIVPPSTTTHPIRIVSFDGWSFADQVLFMNSVDILISPHGAQLTSIPFLPACASIFELFPTGYHPPYHFGTLAAASGITHSYTALTRGFERYFKEETKVGMANVTNRSTSRNVQLCPPLLDVVEQIMTVIQQWHERCAVVV
jgi:hypothetical protein